MMKLLGSTDKKITKDKNGKNVPDFETNEVIAVYCNMFHNDFQQVLVNY